MAPSFLKEIRRRSKSSFRTDRSTDSSNASNNESNASVPKNKSSSTLSSIYGGTTTPPASSFLSKSPSAGNLQQQQQQLGTPPPLPNVRPTVSTSSSNRYSVSGMSGLGSPSPKSTLPTSPYAPRILSITDNTWVCASDSFNHQCWKDG